MKTPVRNAALAMMLVVVGSLSIGNAQAPRSAGDNVVLITLDGARTEEIFGGLQLDILKSTLREGQAVEESPTYRQFWAETAQARREKLMPFFWKTLMAERGSIAGNPSLGSAVRLNNRHRFSYPGYAEILLGEPHDDVINSNAAVRNPYTTVLEEMRDRLKLEPTQVATVGSWSRFTDIAEHTCG